MSSTNIDIEPLLYNNSALTRSAVSPATSKLHNLVNTLESQALEWPKVDVDRYKFIIKELSNQLDQVGTFGNFFDLLYENIGTPVEYITNSTLDHEKCRAVLSKSKLVLFLHQIDESPLRTGFEKQVFSSTQVWFFYRLLSYQFEIISKQPQDELVHKIGIFISLGFQLASLLSFSDGLFRGLLFDLKVLNLCVDISNMYPNKFDSQKFLHMISAITISHFSNLILNETLSQIVETNRSPYNTFDKWTALFMTLCSSNSIPMKPDGPSIFDVLARTRMLPLVHSTTWSLEVHYTNVFADICLTDYIPVACELLVISKRSTQTLKFLLQAFHSFENTAQFSLALEDILKLFKSPLGLDIAVLKLNEAKVFDGLSKVIATPCMPVSVVENSKTIMNILSEKCLKHFSDLSVSLSSLASIAPKLGVSSDYCVDRVTAKHLEIMFNVIDGSDNIFKSPSFSPIICLASRILEKTSQTLEGLEQFNLELSKLNGPLSSSVIISQLTYRLGKHLLKNFGQPYDSFFSKSFNRVAPQMTLGLYDVSVVSEKGTPSLQKTGVLNEYHHCVMLFVIVLYRNIYLCIQIFQGNTDPIVSLIREKELDVIIDALAVAYDVATIRYPNSFGGATLHNVVLETLKLLYCEYDKTLVQKRLSGMAMESIKYKFLVRELIPPTKDGKRNLDEVTFGLESLEGTEVELDLSNFRVSDIGLLAKPLSMCRK
jgi:hypothetical protein